MGLNNNQNKTFLGLREGKILKKVVAGTPDAVNYPTDAGEARWYLTFSSLTGYITGFRTKDGWKENTIDLCVEITDAGEVFELQMQVGGGNFNSFVKALPNVDLAKEVTLSPKFEVVDNKKQTTLFINQGGKAVKFYFTKDNPNGMPDAEKITNSKGEIKGWDFADQQQFLLSYLEKEIKPKLTHRALLPKTELEKEMNTKTEVSTEPHSHTPSDDVDDDLPF